MRNRLPEFEATAAAHRWRGEALLAKGYVGEAEVALNRALNKATLRRPRAFATRHTRGAG